LRAGRKFDGPELLSGIRVEGTRVRVRAAAVKMSPLAVAIGPPKLTDPSGERSDHARYRYPKSISPIAV